MPLERSIHLALKTDPSGDRLGDYAMDTQNELPVSQNETEQRPGVSLYSHYVMSQTGRQVFADGLLRALGQGVGIFCCSKAADPALTRATAFYAHYPRAVSSDYGSITGVCPGHVTLGDFELVNPTPGFPGGANIRFAVDGDTLYAGAFKDAFGTAPADNSIWKSLDAGGTWALVHDGSDFDSTFGPYGFGLLAGDLYAWGTLSSGGGATYKSTDDGANWVQTETHGNGASWGKRAGFGSCVFGGKLWIVGGSIAGESPPRQSDTWSSPDGVTWTQAANTLPWGLFAGLGQVGRTGMGCAASIDAMFITAGSNQNNGKLSDCWTSANGIAWTQVAPPASFANRGTAALAESDGALIMYAGALPTPGDLPFDTPQGLDDVWQSTDGGATWAQVAGGVFPLPGVTGTFRQTAALAVVSGTLVLAGGINLDTSPPSNAPLTDVWASPISNVCVFP